MGSIERRLADLERRFGPPADDPVESARMEEKREELRVRLERIREQAKQEEETGDDRRLRAVEEVEEHLRQRIEERRHYGA